MLLFNVNPELILEPYHVLWGGRDPSAAKGHLFSAGGAFGRGGVVVDVMDDDELRLA
jgi:hypothetical protein